MKPHKPVTLIDLEGKPICQYVEGKTEIYYDEPHKGVYDGCLVIEPTGVKVNGEKYILKPLMAFLQDQLTFIRNGMWETLAIYQTTLGKYWEVPWYNLQDLLDTGLVYECRPVVRHNARQHKQKVPVDYFIENYPDVFSKLTPWEGESTDATH